MVLVVQRRDCRYVLVMLLEILYCFSIARISKQFAQDTAHTSCIVQA